jgi:hypothetical protein
MTSLLISWRNFSKQFPLRFFCYVVCLALLATGAQAQQATALIAGTVKDASGALVIGAKVTFKNSNTNIARGATTNKDGEYLFTLVPIGAYELTVEHQGFDKYVRREITLEINQNARLDVSLQVGTQSQVIEVN